jgi:hypothetical protein
MTGKLAQDAARPSCEGRELGFKERGSHDLDKNQLQVIAKRASFAPMFMHKLL